MYSLQSTHHQNFYIHSYYFNYPFLALNNSSTIIIVLKYTYFHHMITIIINNNLISINNTDRLIFFHLNNYLKQRNNRIKTRKNILFFNFPSFAQQTPICL